MKYICTLFLLLPLVSIAESTVSIYDLDSNWTNQRNEVVNLRELAGKPRVVCMFFSHCAYACPRITADMQSIEARLSEEQRTAVGFVMVSFDVARDTPDQLATFAATKELPDSWQLLHGGNDETRELAAALGVRYRQEDDGNFAHANIIALLDAHGTIIHQHEGLRGDLSPLVSALIREVNP
jgi:protein SCO1/2